MIITVMSFTIATGSDAMWSMYCPQAEEFPSYLLLNLIPKIGHVSSLGL
jgi:hypothetical protein